MQFKIFSVLVPDPKAKGAHSTIYQTTQRKTELDHVLRMIDVIYLISKCNLFPLLRTSKLSIA